MVAKPQVSLTVPNCDQFARVSLTILDFIQDAIAKAKNLICKSIAQILKQDLLTKVYLAFAMAIYYYLTQSNQT